LARLFCR